MRIALLIVAVVVLLLAAVACSPITALNALVPTDKVDIQTGLSYGPDPRNKLDVYVPREKSATPRPVIVFIYGGSWDSGERSEYKFVGEALAARGYVVVVPDYRIYPQVRYPDFLVDTAQAVVWAMREAAHYGGDNKQLYVMGHSAGGYNAAMIALDPRWLGAQGHTPRELAGFIGLAGPYDFLPIDNPNAQPVFFHPNYPPGTQAIDYVSAAAPRTFLGAAVKDSLVNPERNTQQLASKLSAAGVPVTLRMYERVNHVTLIGAFAGPLRWLAPVLDDVDQFIKDAPHP